MRILTITGPSCSGKTTLLKNLVDNYGFGNVVSHTTRPMRPGEVEGRDYHFVDDNYFEWLNEKGGLLEHVSFSGYKYGVSKDALTAAAKQSEHGVVALIVEPNGLHQVIDSVRSGKVRSKLNCIFIDGDIQLLIGRYLERMKGQVLDKNLIENTSRRLSSLIVEKKTWYSEFVSLTSDLNPYDYWDVETSTLTVPEFNPQNEQEVVDRVLKLVKNG